MMLDNIRSFFLMSSVKEKIYGITIEFHNIPKHDLVVAVVYHYGEIIVRKMDDIVRKSNNNSQLFIARLVA
jgi:hypothetical protein